MDTFTRWFITIAATLITGGLWQLNLNGERLTRVEEKQKFVIEKLEHVIIELRKHEAETRKP